MPMYCGCERWIPGVSEIGSHGAVRSCDDAPVERTEASEGMQRLIGARRDMDELLAGLRAHTEAGPGGRFRRDGEARSPASPPPTGSDWEMLALERRLAALEERAERAVVHLEVQSRLAEEQVGARIEVRVQEALARIEAVVAAAELRLAAVDAAHDREERIRERIESARREAEGRVRAAERRLVEVLARIDRLPS